MPQSFHALIGAETGMRPCRAGWEWRRGHPTQIFPEESPLKIELTLNPSLHVSGDRVATDEWIRSVHQILVKGEKLPNIRFSLEEWEDFEEKRSSTLKWAVDIFLKEVEQIFKVYLSVREIAAPKSALEPFRVLDLVLLSNHYPGDFEGHPVMGPLHPRQLCPRPGPHPENICFHLFHKMPDGVERACPIYLDPKEVNRLRLASPAAALGPEDFLAAKGRSLGLRGSHLEPRVMLREAVPSFVAAAVAGVREGKYKWKDIQKPTFLSEDGLGLV